MSVHCQQNGHEPGSYETIGGVTGLFFIIYSFKNAKDQINNLNLKKGKVVLTNCLFAQSFLALSFISSFDIKKPLLYSLLRLCKHSSYVNPLLVCITHFLAFMNDPLVRVPCYLG